MTEAQRQLAEQMRSSIHTLLDEMAGMSRAEFLRSDAAQWRVMQAVVVVGHGADVLFWLLVQYPDPWWRRAARLGNRLRGGQARFDPAYLWEALPRDWPVLERKLQRLLDDNPAPVPHG